MTVQKPSEYDAVPPATVPDNTETPEDFEFDFVTSDTHFGHARIIEFSKRPFASLGQMHGEFIKRWNGVVGPTDKVLHLGDLCLGPFEQSLALTMALNGEKYLIPGNHDRVSNAFDGGRHIDRFTPIYEAAGWRILPEIIQRRIGGKDVLLSHYPYDGDSRPGKADRQVHVRPIDAGLPVIHGHVHTEFAVRGRQFNAGVDIHDFTPVHRSVIEDWVASLA